MNPYGRPGGPGFGRSFFVPGHGPDGAHPLEWAIFAIVLALLLLAITNLALAYAGRGPRRGKPSWRRRGLGGPPDPLRMLSVRYARGEIGRDEFLRSADDLRGAPQPQPEPQPAPSSGGDDEPTAEQPPAAS